MSAVAMPPRCPRAAHWQSRTGDFHRSGFHRDMLVIRRMDDGKRSYTAMFLPGEEPRIFPTSDQEHARILQIFKQDKPYEGVWNDFTEFQIGRDTGARRNSG